jgi:hypothetical protein
MAQADDTPTRWIALPKAFACYAKLYGEAVAKRDLLAWLGSGDVSWRAEERGRGPFRAGDKHVWRPDPGEALTIHWSDGRLIRETAPQRIVVRPGETVYRQAPHRYEFVRVEIALDELLACMPEDVRAKMQSPNEKRKDESGKESPLLEAAKRRLRKAFPGYAPEDIPKEFSAGDARKRIHEDPKDPPISLSTIKRAMGRENK